MKPVTILEAIADPKLLGKSFRPRLFKDDSWRNWKTFLKVLFALPLNADELRLYRQCTGRTLPPSQPFAECFIVAGRRSGKSYIISCVATFIGAFIDFSPYLSPGETPTILVIASDKAQGQILLRYIRAFFAQSPVLREMVRSDLKETIVLKSGLEITVAAGDYRGVRGKTVVCCCLDELAFYGNDDAELIAAIRPSQITIPNSLLLGISSPWAKRGVLFSEHQEHFGKENDSTLVWQASSALMNPTISKLAILSAYAKDAVSARTEYDAQFRSDLESFISRQAVLACVQNGVFERAPIKRTSDYSAFVDMGGGRRDSSVLCVAHDEDGIGVLDLLKEVQAPYSPEIVVQGFCETLKRWKISEVMGDAYSAQWNVDSWARNGVTYRTSELSRSEIYLNALPIIMSGQCRLLDNERMISQLTSLERKTRTTVDCIDHAPGAFDDVCNAAMGSIVLALQDVCIYGVLDFIKSPRALELANMDAAGVQTEIVAEPKPEAPPMSPEKAAWWAKEQRRMMGLE